MFNIDRWHEVFATLRANLLRAVLTSLAVAWGIFMLVVLLGFGGGLKAWAQSQFKDDAINSFWLWRGQTSQPYKGHNRGRLIEFTNRDYERTRRYPYTEHASARYYISGAVNISHGNKTSSFDVRAIHPEHRYLEETLLASGRLINQIDIDHLRKNTCIGVDVAKFLFADRDPIGQYIVINQVAFQVVGTFRDDGAENEEKIVYIPISTAQRVFGDSERVNLLLFTVHPQTSGQESRTIERNVRHDFAAHHNFAPSDKRAVRIRNNIENFEKFSDIFVLIRIFVWAIGIGTIIAGVVGVSNIMLISVQERTREFGIRKALGAPPGSILVLVVQESILITTLAGYLGLLSAVLFMEMLAALAPHNVFFSQLVVEFDVACYATLILVFAGLWAGYIPARRASRIAPVVALKAK